MSLFISIVTTLLCLPWPGFVLMSPMAIAAEGFSSSKTSIIQAMVFFIYPAGIFLLLKVAGLSFYGTDPLRWAVAIFAIGTLISLAYGLPRLLSNLYKGIPNDSYHIGKNNVYFNGCLIKGADPDTFVQYHGIGYDLNDRNLTYITIPHAYYSKDRNYVYLENKQLPDADAETFDQLANDDTRSYWHDKRNAYYKWMRISEADGATFRYLGYPYTCDKNQVFFENKVVPGADVATFRSLGGHAGRDAYNVFVHALRADNVQDVASFETQLLDNDWFGRDKAQIYSVRYAPPHPLLPFPDADPETFETIGNHYAKDKNRVYYYGYSKPEIAVLEGANPVTFRLHYDREKNTDATDGERYYGSGILYTE